MKDVENIIEILSEERVDKIGFGNLRLIQKPEDFCYGIDAVLLATFADLRENTKVIDLGTGTGIVPLILSHRTKTTSIVGVEIQEDSYKRAVRNIRLNKLDNRIQIIHSDVNNLVSNKHVEPYSFDAVFSNPPYVKVEGGIKNQNEAKYIARHEASASLEDFIQTAALLLRDKGDFYMVHRPNRLVDICTYCRISRLEPKEIRFVVPNRETAPNIILIHCVKYGKPELKFLNPLVVYEKPHSYSKEILALYEKVVEKD